MDGKNKPVRHPRSERFTRATASVLQFFTRALTHANNPLTATPEVQELPQDTLVPKERGQSFSSELFAELLIELPEHRRQLVRAREASDRDTLGRVTHKLLGAVTYCDAPELEEVLRELRRALKTADQHTINVCHERALNVIDSTLRYSGYRCHG